MELHQVLRMKEGEDEDSYAKNSSFQKLLITESKHMLEQSIKELCLSGIPDCIKMADLGCSSGPNTFLAIGMILESIKRECNRSNYKLPSIQVFLNDLVSNDFNTVFGSLPTFYGELEGEGWTSGSCFIAAMPGSFYGRLFPANSMHSSNSLHWLSQVPEGLVTVTGSTLNRRNIYLAKESPPNVHDAYLEQFQKDFTNFLRLRSIEMVSHGQLFLNLLCSNHHNDDYDYQQILSMTLNDLVMEGIVEKTKLDTFNIPVYEPSVEEVRHLIENEGSFKIMHFEANEIRRKGHLPDNFEQIIPNRTFIGENMAKTIKAALGPIIASHFGDAIIDDLFSRYARKASEYMERMKITDENLLVSLSKK